MKNAHNFIDRDGSTPLDHDQIVGIRFSHLTTMGELDELEDENIQKGLEWLNRQKTDDYLSYRFLCKLHEKLFGDVWKWAGKFRTAEVNISKYRSHDEGPQLINFFEDLKLWIAGGKMEWDICGASPPTCDDPSLPKWKRKNDQDLYPWPQFLFPGPTFSLNFCSGFSERRRTRPSP